MFSKPEMIPEHLPWPRAIVTGSAGYIGSSLMALLVDSAEEIVRVSRRPPLPPAPSGRAVIRDVFGDIRDSLIWRTVLDQPATIFHLASQTSDRAADADPLGDFQSNVLPVIRIFETCREIAAESVVIFAGTVLQNGAPATPQVDESTPDEFRSVYALHKSAAEAYLLLASRRGWCRGVSLRLCNVFGPGPTSVSGDRGVLNGFVRKAIAGDPLTVFGSGEFLRDYIFVEDVAEAFLGAARAIERTAGRHFILGTGAGTTIVDAVRAVASAVRKRTGRNVEVQNVDPPEPLSAIDRRNVIGNSRAFQEVSGWRPRVGLAEGIERTLDVFVRSEEGLK